MPDTTEALGLSFPGEARGAKWANYYWRFESGSVRVLDMNEEQVLFAFARVMRVPPEKRDNHTNSGITYDQWVRLLTARMQQLGVPVTIATPA